MPLVVTLLASTVAVAACAPHRNVYDSTYNDNHRWDRHEEAAYRRWEADRQLRDIEYQQRALAEQKAYWEWRHNHPDQG